MWKIINNKVPNCNINVIINPRFGKLIDIPKLNTKATQKIQSLRDSSFHVHGAKLFNCLPNYLRNSEVQTVEEFKECLDVFLSEIPDEPSVQGTHYTPSACDLITGKASNSLIDQVRQKSTRNRRMPGNI